MTKNRKQKVLLMGPGKGGKTSMRSIIFANYLARDCQRLGLTIELERSQVTFLSNLVLNLWDCGGQTSFIDNYLKRSREFIFSDVAVLIYVFDLEALSKRTTDEEGERETLPLPSETPLMMNSGDNNNSSNTAGESNGTRMMMRPEGGGVDRTEGDGIGEGVSSSSGGGGLGEDDHHHHYEHDDDEVSGGSPHNGQHHHHQQQNMMVGVGNSNNKEVEWSKDRVMSYFVSCVDAIKEHSPDAKIFCLLHKKDRLVHSRRDHIIARREEEIQAHVPDTFVRYFATSIWDDSLFKAWSSILNSLVPDSELLNQRLREVLTKSHTYEIALFEKSTSLCISYQHHHHQQQHHHLPTGAVTSTQTSSTSSPSASLTTTAGAAVVTTSSSVATTTNTNTTTAMMKSLGTHDTPTRISNIIKKFKLSCMRDSKKFHSLHVVTSEYTALLEDFTENTMILVVSNEPEVSLMVHRLNAERARREFHLFLRSTEGAAMSEVL